MVHAIVVQTLQPSECEVLYYRFYASTEVGGEGRRPKLFETPADKKELARHVSRKVQLQFHTKLAQSLVPPVAGGHAPVRGGYTERGWKERVELPVVWQGWLGSGLGLTLLCSGCDNLMQAQNVLEVLSGQLEKHLQFVSAPAMALSLVETVALVVNQFLPSGRLLFLNTRLVHMLERQLESNLVNITVSFGSDCRYFMSEEDRIADSDGYCSSVWLRQVGHPNVEDVCSRLGSYPRIRDVLGSLVTVARFSDVPVSDVELVPGGYQVSYRSLPITLGSLVLYYIGDTTQVGSTESFPCVSKSKELGFNIISVLRDVATTELRTPLSISRDNVKF